MPTNEPNMPSLPRLILASGSPRRKDLLTEAGYDFQIVKPLVEEIEDASIPIRELTALNARLKADAVAGNYRDCIILAADTLVLLGETVFGKPTNEAEAERMLRELNGRTHHVFTAVVILCPVEERVSNLTVTTEVTFKSLTGEEMRRYHAQIDPMDKAGAYAAQEYGELIIDRIVGSMSNVIGLPMDEVSLVLAETFQISPASEIR